VPHTPPKIELVVPSSDADLAAYYTLRWRLLRGPWGQPPGSERDELEAESWHIAAQGADGQTIGVGRLHRLEGQSGQIRYMAVEPAWRRQGIGAAILMSLEATAVAQGMRRIELDAREGSVGFYQRHGYAITGPAHTLFGQIAHQRMAKTLAPRPDS
jgi:N-acetylglutamate synthase-like GNAT family acetyltransferase